MKKAGIVGGLGPESTIDYYKGIITAFHNSYDDTGYPEIAIESCNIKELLGYSNIDRWDIVAERLARKFESLRSSGCDFGVIASNTPHKVFDDIQKGTTLPLLSIIEATCDYAVSIHSEKLCLLGTKFTMQSDFYQKVFDKKNIQLVVPEEAEMDYIHEKIFSELEYGIVKQETKERYLKIIDRIVNTYHCDGVILGCTEFPLLIKQEDVSLAYLDTTAIHINKIVEVIRQ